MEILWDEYSIRFLTRWYPVNEIGAIINAAHDKARERGDDLMRPVLIELAARSIGIYCENQHPPYVVSRP